MSKHLQVLVGASTAYTTKAKHLQVQATVENAEGHLKTFVERIVQDAASCSNEVYSSLLITLVATFAAAKKTAIDDAIDFEKHDAKQFQDMLNCNAAKTFRDAWAKVKDLVGANELFKKELGLNLPEEEAKEMQALVYLLEEDVKFLKTQVANLVMVKAKLRTRKPHESRDDIVKKAEEIAKGIGATIGVKVNMLVPSQ